VNRQKTRWFVSPYFKYGRGDIVYLGDPGEPPEELSWRRLYLKDQAIGATVGFQFAIREKKRAQSAVELFAGPQYIFRKYYEQPYGLNANDIQTG